MLLDEPLGLIVERLRRRGTDDASVEVKACTNKLSTDVWETVSAFANTAGGLIILGLNEAEGFVPSANFAIDRVRDQFVSGIGDGGSAAVVAHAPRYELDRGEVDGLQVLLVRIFELELKAKPCYIGARGVQNGSYKRVDDKDIKMSPAELYELQSALLPSDADGTVVSEATVEDLDPDVVRSIIANRRLQTPRVLRGADTLEKQLVRLNITTKDGAVKLAGLLSAGIYPQQFYPKLMIDVAVHSDVEKSAPGQPRFIDRQLCDGPIPACIEDALAAIGRNLRKAAIVQGAGRREDWEVPQEVLREALANACIHREYSPMFVGHAEGAVAESQGSGIPAMIREMESRSLGRPKFIVKADSFTVLLSRHGAELAENRTWIQSHVGTELTDREETLLMFMREHGCVCDVQKIREALKWDSDDIRLICGGLVNKHVLSKCDKDTFEIIDMSRGSSASTADRILEALSAEVDMTAREIAVASGVKISSVRYHLPKMADKGLIEVMGSSTSRNRRYRKK